MKPLGIVLMLGGALVALVAGFKYESVEFLIGGVVFAAIGAFLVAKT